MQRSPLSPGCCASFTPWHSPVLSHRLGAPHVKKTWSDHWKIPLKVALFYDTDLQACKQHHIRSRRLSGSFKTVWKSKIVQNNEIVWKPHSSCPILPPDRSLSLTGHVQTAHPETLTGMEQLPGPRHERNWGTLCGSLTSKQRLNLLLWYQPRTKIEKMKVCMKPLLLALLKFLPHIVSQLVCFILFSDLTPFQFALIQLWPSAHGPSLRASFPHVDFHV